MGKCYARKPLVDLQHDKWDPEYPEYPEYYVSDNGMKRGKDRQFRKQLASVASRLYHSNPSKIKACGPSLRSESEPPIQFKTAEQAAADKKEQEEKAAREKQYASDT